MRRPRVSGSSLRRFVLPVAMLVLATLVGAVAGWPSPYALLLPGEAQAVIPRVMVPPDREQEAGELFFTVVNVRPVTWSEWAVARLDPQVEEIVSRDEIEPPDVPREVVDAYNRALMDESKAVASVVALREAGYPVEVRGQGARVVAVLPNSPAQGVLHEGDVILAQDGVQMPTAVDLVTSVQKRKPGDTVQLTVRRGDQTQELSIVTIPSPTEPGRPMVGVMLLTELFDFTLPFPVTIQSDGIGGPSAGLMFALGVYDRVTPGLLAGGQKVAGTGTLDVDGNVGPIGGAAEKVIGAERAGAVVFLAPSENLDEARSAATTAKVVEVRNFGEALAAVRALGA
jgi:Lon-like protease